MTPLMDLAFPPTSRYHGIGRKTRTDANGCEVSYLARRFLPDPSGFALLAEHRIAQEDRLDVLAARYLGDALQSWRICDANATMHPEDLLAPNRIGERLRITLPEGVPGVPNAAR